MTLRQKLNQGRNLLGENKRDQVKQESIKTG